MGEHELTLGDLFAYAKESLPYGWELLLRMDAAGVDLALYDPDGKPAEVCLDDMDTSEAIEAYVNHARCVEDMPSADFTPAAAPPPP